MDQRLTSKREKASETIISALDDTSLCDLIEMDDNPKSMRRLFDAGYAYNRTVSHTAVQTQLYRMVYRRQSMSEYIDQFYSLFAKRERMGKHAAIPKSHKASMLFASIYPQCPLKSAAAALRTKESNKLT